MSADLIYSDATKLAELIRTKEHAGRSAVVGHRNFDRPCQPLDQRRPLDAIGGCSA